jgi:hypothetical protein
MLLLNSQPNKLSLFPIANLPWGPFNNYVDKMRGEGQIAAVLIFCPCGILISFH